MGLVGGIIGALFSAALATVFTVVLLSPYWTAGFTHGQMDSSHPAYSLHKTAFAEINPAVHDFVTTEIDTHHAKVYSDNSAMLDNWVILMGFVLIDTALLTGVNLAIFLVDQFLLFGVPALRIYPCSCFHLRRCRIEDPGEGRGRLNENTENMQAIDPLLVLLLAEGGRLSADIAFLPHDRNG